MHIFHENGSKTEWEGRGSAYLYLGQGLSYKMMKDRLKNRSNFSFYLKSSETYKKKIGRPSGEGEEGGLHILRWDRVTGGLGGRSPLYMKKMNFFQKFQFFVIFYCKKNSLNHQKQKNSEN